MSDLDKEAVLDEFTAEYKKAHGKKPKIEDSNGWYSVDGGKNLRLAQLDEWAQDLKSGKVNAAEEDSGKQDSAKAGKSSTAKKSSSSKTDSKKASDKGTKKASKKTAKKSAKKPAKKSASKATTGKQTKSAPKKGATKKAKTKQHAGNMPAQAWQAHLNQQDGQSRLPRGFKAD
ncbi:MAG: hypothetical protein JJU03_03950 [Idiomarina sp.]|nr:hypothetical protein [Idiomarina sp.]